MSKAPFIFGLAGYSGSGKTTLAEKLIQHAVSAGIAISSIKHAHHRFEADIEGKDSWRHRKAGAGQVLIASAHRAALFTENKVEERPALSDLLQRLDDCDMVLVEGFKSETFLKLEILNPDGKEPPQYLSDPHIRAVISDDALQDCPLPQFKRDDCNAIFAFIHKLYQEAMR